MVEVVETLISRECNSSLLYSKYLEQCLARKCSVIICWILWLHRIWILSVEYTTWSSFIGDLYGRVFLILDPYLISSLWLLKLKMGLSKSKPSFKMFIYLKRVVQPDATVLTMVCAYLLLWVVSRWITESWRSAIHFWELFSECTFKM